MLSRLFFVRYLTLISCCILISLASCRKDNPREFTSDVPGQFRTNIEIYHYEIDNTTRVYAYFTYMPSTWEVQYLNLPSNSYVKINGALVNFDPSHYPLEFQGKPDCLIEFKNHDDVIYTNNITPPDTAYFINLPDSVSCENLQIQVNPPNLNNFEGSRFCIDSHGDDYGCDYIVDTTGLVDITHGVRSGESHLLTLYRSKRMENPVLPAGGGGIVYFYVSQRTIYCQ